MNEKEGREWERGRRKIWYKRRGKEKVGNVVENKERKRRREYRMKRELKQERKRWRV